MTSWKGMFRARWVPAAVASPARVNDTVTTQGPARCGSIRPPREGRPGLAWRSRPGARRDSHQIAARMVPTRAAPAQPATHTP